MFLKLLLVLAPQKFHIWETITYLIKSEKRIQCSLNQAYFFVPEILMTSKRVPIKKVTY